MSASDRAMFDQWVAAQLTKYTTETNCEDVFDFNVMVRANKSFKPEDAYRHPWRQVRPYLMREFVWFIESNGNPRYTFAEFNRAMKAERDAERAAADESEALDTLAYLRDLMPTRGELIARARAAKTSWADICEASGLSRMQAHTLATNYANTPF